MKKISVLGLVLLAMLSVAATIQFYSQQPVATVLEDSMVIAVEKAVPQGYRSTTLASLRDYTLNNLAVTNYTIYSTNFWISNSYVSNYVVTNVYNDTYASNFFLTQNYVTNQYSTNVTITNWYAPDTYVSNFFNTNIYVNDTYVSNFFSTNIYNTVVTNVYDYLYVSNAYVTNITAKNLQVHNVYANSGIFTNGITNLVLTPNTIVQSDANRALASVPNGSGALTNDGSGNFGWSTLSGGDQVWTNDGTAIYPFLQTKAPYVYLVADKSTNVIGSTGLSVNSMWDSGTAYANMTHESVFVPASDDASTLIRMESYNTNGSEVIITLFGQVDSTGVVDASLLIKTNGTPIFEANKSGVITANAYVTTEYTWSGPTNAIDIGEFTYVANTPCAVTNLTTNGSVLLSITNASSSNITFTVHSPIRIPYGETSRSYTVTNGDVFFGSFRKGSHGSVFVPRGFYNP